MRLQVHFASLSILRNDFFTLLRSVASMSDIELEQLLKRQEEQEEMLSELRSRSFKIDGTDRTELSENAIYDLHQRDDELFLSLDVPGVMEAPSRHNIFLRCSKIANHSL